jgi:hypothetical protein
VEIGWCQGADVRGRSGEPVRPWDTEAVAWSTLGALVAVAESNETGLLEQLGLHALALWIATGSDELKTWNDEPTRTRADVLSVYGEARALLPQLVEAYQQRAVTEATLRTNPSSATT